jgi:hypothetical protein
VPDLPSWSLPRARVEHALLRHKTTRQCTVPRLRQCTDQRRADELKAVGRCAALVSERASE